MYYDVKRSYLDEVTNTTKQRRRLVNLLMVMIFLLVVTVSKVFSLILIHSPQSAEFIYLLPQLRQPMKPFIYMYIHSFHCGARTQRYKI